MAKHKQCGLKRPGLRRTLTKDIFSKARRLASAPRSTTDEDIGTSLHSIEALEEDGLYWACFGYNTPRRNLFATAFCFAGVEVGAAVNLIAPLK